MKELHVSELLLPYILKSAICAKNGTPVKVYYFQDKYYEAGIEVVKKNHDSFKIYNREKTIADLFRYRNKIGEDIVIESLKSYLSGNNKNIPRLLEYSEISNIKKIILLYLKAIVG